MTESGPSAGDSDAEAPGRRGERARGRRGARRDDGPGRRAVSIRVRILAIALAPSIVLLLVGAATAGVLLRSGYRTLQFSQDIQGLARPSSNLLSGLQTERLASMGFVAGVTPEQQLKGAYAQRDKAFTAYEVAVGAVLDNAKAQEREALTAFSAATRGLDALRQKVSSKQATSDDVFNGYNSVLDRWAATLTTIALDAPDEAVSVRQMTALSVFQVSEGLSRSAATGLAIVDDPTERARLGGRFTRDANYYHAQLERVTPQLTPRTGLLLGVLYNSPDWRTVLRAEVSLAISVGARIGGVEVTQADFPVSRTAWANSASVVAHILIDAYLTESTQAAQRGVDLGRQTLVRSAALGGGLLLTALLTIGFSLRLSGGLVGRLRRLRAETLEIADVRLPLLLGELRAGRPVDPSMQMALSERSRDEIGQVASAFSSAEQAAVDAAVIEMQTRQGIRSVFHAIAHRSQIIIHRQIKVLDEVQRSVEDPEQMRALFELDHLATRARRNAENLTILSGHRPGRQWRRPVALVEVVRAAVAEGIVYSRVTTTPMPDVWVEGRAVADVIHLLAELVDNATSFSPPQAQVEIRAGLVGKGVAVEVEDRGLGMEPAQRQELNALLHQAPDFDILALSDDSRLGMFVVARLASTHGITVTLDASPYGGTRAIVLLPVSMLATQPEAGTPPDAAPGGPSDVRPRTGTGADPAPVTDATADVVAEPVREPVPDGAALVGAGRADNAAGSAPPRPADRFDAPDTKPLRPPTLLVERRSPAQFPAASPAEGPTEPSRRSGPPQQADPRPEGRPPLPKRTRQANLAPGLRGGQEAPDAADPDESEDTPWYREDVRSRLNAFRQGTTLGRAADTTPVGDDAEHRSPDEGANP